MDVVSLSLLLTLALNLNKVFWDNRRKNFDTQPESQRLFDTASAPWPCLGL